MANIAVLESHQSDTDLPTGGRIKRSAGYSLVNRGEAYWVKKPVLLKRLAARPTSAPNLATPALRSPYIPDELPPAEVHGCTFEDPVERKPGTLVFTRLWAERQECRA